MNPIIAEMERLFPEYTLTRSQIRETERASKPQEVADSLEFQACDIRKMFESKLGKGIATDKDIILRMNLSKAIKSYGDMSISWLLEPLGVERAFQLGQKSNGFLRDLYRIHIGEYDQHGASWWESAFVFAAKRDGTLKDVK